jgi:hypothetical protein
MVNQLIMKLKSLYTKTRNKTILYEDCSDTTLDVYLNIIKHNDLKYLVKSGSIPSNEILTAKMEKINEEFMVLRGEKSTLSDYDKIQYKEQLVLKVHCVSTIINVLIQRMEVGLMSGEHIEKYVARFKQFGFRLNRDKPLVDELNKITNELNALQTTIEILHNEIYPEKKESETEEEKKLLSFHSMLLMYQRILKIDKIDIKTTTLLEFVALETQVKEEMKRKNTAE